MARYTQGQDFYLESLLILRLTLCLMVEQCPEVGPEPEAEYL